MINFTLNSTITVEIIPAVSVTANTITIEKVIDDGSNVIATINFNNQMGFKKELLLWNELTLPTYKQIGNWTDNDVHDRIIELITNNS